MKVANAFRNTRLRSSSSYMSSLTKIFINFSKQWLACHSYSLSFWELQSQRHDVKRQARRPWRWATDWATAVPFTLRSAPKAAESKKSHLFSLIEVKCCKEVKVFTSAVERLSLFCLLPFNHLQQWQNNKVTKNNNKEIILAEVTIKSYTCYHY